MEEKLVYRTGPVKRTMVFDRDEPDKFGIYTETDLTQVLETNKALREQMAAGPRTINKYLARAPMVVYEQSIREEWDEDDWRRWLNDPDNAAHRIWPGRV